MCDSIGVKMTSLKAFQETFGKLEKLITIYYPCMPSFFMIPFTDPVN